MASNWINPLSSSSGHWLATTLSAPLAMKARARPSGSDRVAKEIDPVSHADNVANRSRRGL